MCNNIAAMIHCAPGSEVVAAGASHVETSESGALAVFAGARLRTVETADGWFEPSDVCHLMRESKGSRAPRLSAIFAEQTHNRTGGCVWPEDRLAAIGAFAKDHNIALHIDGARIMNAAVAHQRKASEFGRHATSVWMSFTKGLGCPVGSVLAGSKDFIEAAWEWKFRFGGGMRQAGILAAACLYALENNVERLSDDHDNAARFASRIANIDGLKLTRPRFETNMVFFKLTDAGQDTRSIAKLLERDGIRIGVESPSLFRVVTHMDGSAKNMDTVTDAIARLVNT
jgi:threonine aldolase